jgi:TM2 domain-containing membrane protein YozV
MHNFCSSCGAKIKGDYKFCLNCGAQIKTKTGPSSFEDQVAQPPKQKPPAKTPRPAPVPPPQQQTGQTQAYAPTQPKKSNTKLIAGIIAIVVVVVIIVIILFLLSGDVLENIMGGSDSRFVGEWEQRSEYITISWTFNSDGSFEIMGIEGTWRVSGDKICMEADYWGEYAGEMCYGFKFSNNDNTLTLQDNGIEYAVLIKK